MTNSTYRRYADYQFDMQVVENVKLYDDYELLKQNVVAQQQLIHPMPTLESKREKLSRLVSQDYRVKYNKDVELLTGEKLLELNIPKKPIEEIEGAPVSEKVSDTYFTYSGNTLSDIEKIIKKYDLESGEPFERGIGETEAIIGSVKEKEGIRLTDTQIENMGTVAPVDTEMIQPSIESDNSMRVGEEKDDASQNIADVDLGVDDGSDLDYEDEGGVTEDTEQDFDYLFDSATENGEQAEHIKQIVEPEEDSSDNSKEGQGIIDSSDANLEDPDSWYSEDDDEDSYDDLEDPDEEYDEEDLEDPDEDSSESGEGISDNEDSYDDLEDPDESEDDFDDVDEVVIPEPVSVQENKPEPVIPQENRVSDKPNAINLDNTDDVDLNFTRHPSHAEVSNTTNIPSSVIVITKSNPEPATSSHAEGISRASPPADNGVSEAEKHDLHLFLRNHPRCELAFAMKYFSKKEIQDNITRGKVIKRGKTLRII